MAATSVKIQLWDLPHPSCQPPTDGIFSQSQNVSGFRQSTLGIKRQEVQNQGRVPFNTTVHSGEPQGSDSQLMLPRAPIEGHSVMERCSPYHPPSFVSHFLFLCTLYQMDNSDKSRGFRKCPMWRVGLKHFNKHWPFVLVSACFFCSETFLDYPLTTWRLCSLAFLFQRIRFLFTQDLKSLH